MYYSCILNDWNNLSLRDIYIPRVGVSLTVCRMIRYCYSFLLGFKCVFQLYSSGFSILLYGYRYYVTLWNGQLHSITIYRTGFRGALLWCWVSFCVPLTNSFLDRVRFIMMVATIIGIFGAILFILNYTFGLLWLGSSWIFSLSIGLSILPSGSFRSCLDSLLG